MTINTIEQELPQQRQQVPLLTHKKKGKVKTKRKPPVRGTKDKVKAFAQEQKTFTVALAVKRLHLPMQTICNAASNLTNEKFLVRMTRGTYALANSNA